MLLQIPEPHLIYPGQLNCFCYSPSYKGNILRIIQRKTHQKIFRPPFIETPSEQTEILLIENLDYDLHHTNHTGRWEAIINFCLKNNVQVFATTYSYDCIAAFSESLQKLPNPDIGKYFRIESGRTVEYSAKLLQTAISHDIEVR